ncbi:MAG: VPLPA-CTERM sorting domain-containing protein, partial [Gammaproteobacteria bacterium]|nr:VPLPA-CTERM sorting domain-containing protein [Gammaproteobacteria bacterium]
LNKDTYALNFAIDNAVYNSAFSGSNAADLIWNVAVGQGLAFDFLNFEDFGIFSTSKTPITNKTSGQVEGALTMMDQLSTAMLGANNDRVPENNLAYHGTIDNGAYAGDPGLWNTNFTNWPINNTATIGEDMGFYYIKEDLFGGPAISTAAAGRWAFDGSNITFGASVSAVPIPAAAWLFGSGLLGLVGVARRKTA